MKKVLVLGCTGSIGRSTLDILRRNPDFSIAGLSAHTSAEKLESLGREFPSAMLALSGGILPDSKRCWSGPGEKGILGMIRASGADIAVNGITGAAGLLPSLAVLEAGMDLALANKETMVMAGSLVRETARKMGRTILPVDSEHSALFQLLDGKDPSIIDEAILTASGGALRDIPLKDLETVTPDQALRHPSWSMGPKITVDSATMANKGLEVIEACRLFDLPEERVKVLIHPQSTVHALIRTTDQALYAQLSRPDMKLPIRDALYWPEQRPEPSCRLDLAGTTLSFSDPDPVRYPLLELARAAIRHSAAAPIAYNAANEIAVAAFLNQRIRFTDIARAVALLLERLNPSDCLSLEEILETDRSARDKTEEILRSIT